MQLSKFQETFKGTMLDPKLLDSEGGAFRENFRQDHGICLENRMKVYRNNVVRSLTDAGLAAYKMSQKLVGYEFLELAMKNYVTQNLPTEGNLNLYAMSFPEFLKTYAPAREVPYLPDFTQLEAYWESAYYAADEYPLDLAKLGEIEQELFPQLRFTFRKSFALMQSDYPLDEIVDYCRASDDEDMKPLSARGCQLMILRPEYKVEIRKLSESEYLFLKALYVGKTIEESAEDLTAINAQDDIAKHLQKHFELGTFTHFEVKGE